MRLQKGKNMNELLKRLSLEAGGSHYPLINPQLQQKFAELIVQECVGVIEKNLTQGIGWRVSKSVKQHFGINDE